MITVLDYGMGNIRSVVKALELYTDRVEIGNDPDRLRRSDALVLPGDGAFAMAMENLHSLGLVEVIKNHIKEDRPFLGICLGYQLLFERSEEFGESEGLGIIPGSVVRFNGNELKVPHMGWNQVRIRGESSLLQGIDNNSYFYFIHSYYPTLSDETWLQGETDYGISFPSIVGRGNVLATQFHPEKSHVKGLTIIENFVKSA